jgi:hypothetical protein
MRSRGVVLVVVAGLAVAAGAVAGRSSAAPAATRTAAAALPSGFDADGIGDLAVGAPGERVGAAAGAGAVAVVFGATDGGLGADGSQFFYQGGGGLGSTAEAGDLVGASVG